MPPDTDRPPLDGPVVPKTDSTKPSLCWGVAWAMLILFGAIVLLRGPGTQLVPSGDFSNFYTAGRAWLTGENPYDNAALQAVWDAAPQAPEHQWSQRKIVALYPPTMYPSVSPFAALPYRTAGIAWMLLNVALVPVLLLLTIALARVRVDRFEALVLAAAVLALAPIQTTLRLGQISLVVVTLVVAALVLMQRGRGWGGGLALGLATAMKPQIGAVFLAYAIIRGQWRSVGSAVGVVGLCYGVGVAMLARHGHEWWAGLRENLHAFSHGGLGDPTPANATYWQLINLQHPLHQLIESRAVVQGLTWVLVVGAGLAAWRWASPMKAHSRELLFLSVIAVLTLLIAYHRMYDAILLVIPLAWLARHVAEGGRLRWGVVCLLLPFVVSGPAALQWAAGAGWVPASLVDSRLWTLVLLPHQVWALLGLAVVLLWRLAVHADRGRHESRPALENAQ